jgi:hypothetical protein
MFEYKCTNDKPDFEEDYDSNLIEEDHNDEDEIAFLKEITSRIDFYELIASEPSYYLRLLETKHELIDTARDYDLFFKRETASEGCKDNLRIKFKIMKDDQFTEIGFFSDANDKATYQEFELQCKRFLKRTISKGQETLSEDEEEKHIKDRSIIETQLEDDTMDIMMQGSDDIFTDYSANFVKNSNNSLNSNSNNSLNSNSSGNGNGNDLGKLEALRASCPKEYLNDYDKMLLSIKYNKKSINVPSKKLYEGLLEVYKNTEDDAVKYEIDTFLFTSNGHLYARR